MISKDTKPLFASTLLLILPSLCGCNGKPTVHSARPLSSQPADVSTRTLDPVAPQDRDMRGVPVIPEFELGPECHDGPAMPRAEASPAPSIESPKWDLTPAESDAASPDVFETPGPALAPFMPPVPATPPQLPKPRCLGDAMTCDRINDFRTEWLSNCAVQQGCAIEAVCRPRDALQCGRLVAQSDCEAQGCVWYTPEPQAAQAPKRRWYDPRRYADLVERRLIDPAAQVEYALWSVRAGFSVGRMAGAATTAESDDEMVPSVCVAPEQKDVAAQCNALTSPEGCESREAMCTWQQLGCIGTSDACGTLTTADSCDDQIGCQWGVE